MKTSTTDDLARDEILYIPTGSIDPDPEQPRLDVDEDLAESIKQHGVLQAIQVRPHPVHADRWMIVDGERRYRGSIRAKLATIPATISLEVEDPADRIIRQIVRNEGKPLTPVEEALAFKKIIEARHAAGDTKYGPVQLGRDLGIAKSTVGDRLTLTEIPTFWLDLIVKGPLQLSHAPILHRWRKVPEKFQAQALEQMKRDERWPGDSRNEYKKAKKGDRLYVGDFETLVRTYLDKFAKPLSEVPGYDGPTEKMKLVSYEEPKVYALDPSKWQPIWRKKIAEKRTAKGKTAAKTKKANEVRTPKWVTVAIEGGAELIERQYFSAHYFDSDEKLKGVKPIIDSGKWSFGWNHHAVKPFDPAVLLREQDLSKLVIVKTSTDEYHGNSYRAVTKWYAGSRDNAALGVAGSAYAAAEREAWSEILHEFGQDLLRCGEAAGRESLIMGGAAPSLVKAIVDGDPENLAELLFSYALAAGCDGAAAVKPTKPAEVLAWLRALDREPAETILNAIAMAERDDLEPPPMRFETWQAATLAGYSKVKIAWGDTAPDPADEAEGQVDDGAEAVDGDEFEVVEATCKYCGCTEENACELAGGACSWYDRSVPVCTNVSCVASYQEDVEASAEEAEGEDALESVEA